MRFPNCLRSTAARNLGNALRSPLNALDDHGEKKLRRPNRGSYIEKR
jgi:hypothetical protein